jgi:F-type H+-transporting ATPase subunit delta
MAAVASRYARALVDSLFSESAGSDPQQALEQIRSFEAAIEGSPDLRNILLSPAVQPAKKRVVIDRLSTASGISPKIRNFLYLIADHHRIKELSGIRKAVGELIDQRLGVVRANIVSAAEMTGEQRQRLQSELSRLTGKQVLCEFAVDSGLIGGVLTRIGSTIYDGSVRGQLDALRRQLVGQ